MPMKFKELIKSHSWLSVELTLLNLYPDQEGLVEKYENVFEELLTLVPEDNEMQIVLQEFECDKVENEESKSTYIDVSGRTNDIDPNTSYAIEFEPWEEWLGMEIAPQTIEHFTKLEIIAHCLYEMTFCGYDQESIQGKFESFNKIVEDFETLSDEQKNQQSTTLEDLINKLKDRDNN